MTDIAQLSTDPGIATIIIGQVYIGTPGGRESCPLRVDTRWMRLPESTDAADAWRHNIMEVFRISCRTPTRGEPPAFTVLQIRPGNYVLTRIAYADSRYKSETAVEEPQGPPRPPWERQTVPRFTVSAGEVVYVGDVALLAVLPARMTGANSPAEAHAILHRLWPEGAARLINRRMLIGPAPAKSADARGLQNASR